MVTRTRQLLLRARQPSESWVSSTGYVVGGPARPLSHPDIFILPKCMLMPIEATAYLFPEITMSPNPESRLNFRSQLIGPPPCTDLPTRMLCAAVGLTKLALLEHMGVIHRLVTFTGLAILVSLAAFGTRSIMRCQSLLSVPVQTIGL